MKVTSRILVLKSAKKLVRNGTSNACKSRCFPGLLFYIAYFTFVNSCGHFFPQTFKQAQFHFIFIIMHGIWPVTNPRLGNPQDKSSTLGPGVGNCLKQSCPGAGGRGKSKVTSLWFCDIMCYFSLSLSEAREMKTTYFQGKMHEFVGEWMERNNLSKLKPVFEGMF